MRKKLLVTRTPTLTRPDGQPTRTTYQDLAGRLQRYFGLAGTIDPQPDYKFSLSFNAGDLFEAGNSAGKGRLWAAAYSSVLGVAQQYSFRFRADVAINRIHLSVAQAAGGNVNVNYFPPSATDVTGGYVGQGIWLERLFGNPNTDLPPVLIGQSVLDGSNAPNRAFFVVLPEAANPLASQHEALLNGGKVHCPRDAGIVIQATSGHSILVNMYGRLL